MRASYVRYNKAGGIWTLSLKSTLHTIASTWMTLFPDGILSMADQNRIIGHLAAVPVALKQQLRDSLDLQELKGILSDRDLAAIQSAPNMPAYCVDVVRAYYYKPSMVSDPDDTSGQSENRTWMVAMRNQFRPLEEAIASSLYLKEFMLAPGFVAVLNTMLGIWFMVLPFVLAEVSGWFTILWVPIIAYGVLGTYSVASELQQPFGMDLNDLDLDALSNDIIRDMLFIQKNYKDGLSRMLIDAPKRLANTQVDDDEIALGQLEVSTDPKMSESFTLAASAASGPLLFWLVIWSVLSVLASLFVNVIWPLPPAVQAQCKPWWCSRIAVDSSVNGFIGFALFLLLGFRLLDSHSRYVSALEIWSDGLIQRVDILANRLFEGLHDGLLHKDDLDRIGGHLAAVGITLVAKLRNESCSEKLRGVLSDSDASRIERASDPVYYCIDVLRAYLFECDRQMLTRTLQKPVPLEDFFMGGKFLSNLESSARQCERIINIPLPYGYVQHLRIFIAIWIMLLPLALVESTGWYSIIYVLFIAYGLLGVEHWATELSDPFGYDTSDVPLDKLQLRFMRLIMLNREMFKKRAPALIYPDRKAFSKKVESIESHNGGDTTSLLRDSDGEVRSSTGYGATKS